MKDKDVMIIIDTIIGMTEPWLKALKGLRKKIKDKNKEGGKK